MHFVGTFDDDDNDNQHHHEDYYDEDHSHDGNDDVNCGNDVGVSWMGDERGLILGTTKS